MRGKAIARQCTVGVRQHHLQRHVFVGIDLGRPVFLCQKIVFLHRPVAIGNALARQRTVSIRQHHVGRDFFIGIHLGRTIVERVFVFGHGLVAARQRDGYRHQGGSAATGVGGHGKVGQSVVDQRGNFHHRSGSGHDAGGAVEIVGRGAYFLGRRLADALREVFVGHRWSGHRTLGFFGGVAKAPGEFGFGRLLLLRAPLVVKLRLAAFSGERHAPAAVLDAVAAEAIADIAIGAVVGIGAALSGLQARAGLDLKQLVRLGGPPGGVGGLGLLVGRPLRGDHGFARGLRFGCGNGAVRCVECVIEATGGHTGAALSVAGRAIEAVDEPLPLAGLGMARHRQQKRKGSDPDQCLLEFKAHGITVGELTCSGRSAFAEPPRCHRRCSGKTGLKAYHTQV